MGVDVRVEYGDDALRRLAEDSEFRPDRWELAVVTAYRRRLQSIAAANDRHDLRALASLDLRSPNGSDGPESSVRLVGRSRLVLGFNVDDEKVATVVGIVESQQWEVWP